MRDIKELFLGNQYNGWDEENHTPKNTLVVTILTISQHCNKLTSGNNL